MCSSGCEVYAAEAEAREQKLTPAVRLAWHQEKSAPVMAKLEDWCRRQLEAKLVEPNSSLGGTIRLLTQSLEEADAVSTAARGAAR